MSLNVPGLCENMRPIIRGRIHAKGSSGGEKSGYFFDGMLVAVGSKLVQEGEEGWTGRRDPFCLFICAYTDALFRIVGPGLLGDAIDNVEGRLEGRHRPITLQRRSATKKA